MTTQAILPSVELELGCEKRRLVFDFNAQAAFEKVTGVSVFDRKAMRTSPRIVRALLWAQLLHFDKQVSFDEFGEIVAPPELSLIEVGKLITNKNLREVHRKVFEAYGLFFKAEEQKDPEEKPENPPSR